VPNISTSNTNSIYSYSASITITFNDNKDPMVLDNVFIKGLVIDYSYDEKNFPLLYVNVSIPDDVVDVLVENQSTGTIIFSLKKRIINGDYPGLMMDYIEGKFVYFMPNSASAYDEQEKEKNPENTNDYNDIYTIGLISLDHINKSKKSVNGMIKSGTKSSILYYMLKDHKLLMEPIQYNSIMKNTILPPIGSVTKALNYFNELEVFYDTPYRFFMDFDMTYLTSSSGKLIRKKGSICDNVIINVSNIYDERNMEGMILDKDLGAYIINTSATFCSMIDSSLADKGYNKISAAITTGNKSDIIVKDVTDSEITNKTTNIRLPNNNIKLLKNIEYKNKLNIITMSISTTKIDSSVITMDKIYTINVDEVYGSNYTGQYLLVQKKEMYTPDAEGLALNISMIFKKIPS